MRMRGGQNYRPQLGEIEPERQLAAENPARFPDASPGDDLDASQAVSLRGIKEAGERVEGALGCAAMQVERARGGKLARAKSLPGRVINTGRLQADDDCL